VRYLRLYLYFLRFSFSRALEFRVDFFFRIIMDSVYYLVNLGVYKVLFLATPVLAGWTEDQARVFVASYLLIDALHMTFFSSNMWWLPFLINRGDVDYYLVRPVNPLFFLSLREFAANSMINLFMAVGIFIWALSELQTPFTALGLAGYVLLILNGFVLHYVLQMLFIIPAFWVEGGKGFNDFFISMNIVVERPDRIFRGALRLLLTTALPFALIASFPARVFFGEPELLLHLFVVTAGAWAVMLWLWQRGLRAYASASS
jgi:ABC-2 type transport system permease protein